MCTGKKIYDVAIENVIFAEILVKTQKWSPAIKKQA